MDTKWVEIRDRGTLVPALAIRLSKVDGWLAERAGFGDTPMVLLINLEKCEAQWDPYAWDTSQGRTLYRAHWWLAEHWDEQIDGEVLDVEFILRETGTPKSSERPTVMR